MICVHHRSNFTWASLPYAAGSAGKQCAPARVHGGKPLKKHGEFRSSMPSGRDTLESAGATEVNVTCDDLAGTTRTHRMARPARVDASPTSCTGPRVQITLTPVVDPGSSTKPIHWRHVGTYAPDPMRHTPRFAVRLLLEGHQEAVAHATEAALLTAMKTITAANAHMQPSTRCISPPLARERVLPTATTPGCGRHDGRCIGLHIARSHKLNSAARRRVRHHDIGAKLRQRSTSPASTRIGMGNRGKAVDMFTDVGAQG